ncbi:MAG: THO complex subunit 2 [Vezdaea aestivalis]|nr:MAG: THO complex subunit 2 [Vezdaea aestivalis]
MAGPGNKRKRPGDAESSREASRPSPYKPQDHSDHYSSSPTYGSQRSGRIHDNYRNTPRGGRGRGRGGSHRGGPRNDSRNPSSPTHPNSPTVLSKPLSVPETQPAQTEATADISQVAVEGVPRVSDVPTKPASPYFWQIMNDEFLKNWDDEVAKLDTQAYSSPLLFATAIQELLRAGLDRRIDPSQAGGAIRKLLGKQKTDTPEQLTVASEDDVESANLVHSEGLLADPQALFLDCVAGLSEVDSENPGLRTILLATHVSPDLMRQILEVRMLENLGLVRPTFQRMYIRKTTNLLYRQNNFNLLREETEGYSKLITELFAASSTGRLNAELVEETVQRVLSLIGAFDLDVGRVLDVTLDVFAAVLVKQYRFFLKYLRSSSWWPTGRTIEKLEFLHQGFSSLPAWALPLSPASALSNKDRETMEELKRTRDIIFWDRVREIGVKAFFEIGGRRVKNIEGLFNKDGKVDDTDLDHQWIKVTGTLPPEGNKVAAQILGFKLRFYTSKIRNTEESLPDNLIFLTALLIKTGFISLRDLYEHLYPTDEDMKASKDEKLREKTERERQKGPRGRTLNALARAGAIADDQKPPPGTEFAPQLTKAAAKSTVIIDEKLFVAEQKISLLRSLLCIGAIPESMYILSRFPWLIDAYPDIVELIHRILHHILDSIYVSLKPIASAQNFTNSKKIAEAGPLKNQIRRTDLEPRRTLRWARMDKKDADAGTDYSFYWDSWSDNVPVCQSYQDVLSLCSTFLKFSGVRIGRDSSLLIKLARIGKQHMIEDTSSVTLARWIDLSKRLLVPALSLSHKSPGIVNEVYDMIKGFPLPVRYSIYSEWYFGSASRIPDVKAAFDDTRWETKDVMKRISTTTVKPVARALAKATHTSPGVAFLTAFSQMETYDNLTETFVECARYFSELAYDVLNWALMNALGGTGRSRVQADGLLTSKWLQVLSDFAGKLFKRYPNVDSMPVLKYVSNQVRMSNTVDLVVLSAIISSMSGITTEINLSEEQTLCLAGGPYLRRRAHEELLDKRYESRHGARRLTKALVDSNIAGSLLVSIAQTRRTCIFSIPDGTHLKILANILDEISSILAKYLELLRSNFTPSQLEKLVPNVADLVREFGIEPRIAFLICRPAIATAISHLEKPLPLNEPISRQGTPGSGVLSLQRNAPARATSVAPQSRFPSPGPSLLNNPREDQIKEPDSLVVSTITSAPRIANISDASGDVVMEDADSISIKKESINDLSAADPPQETPVAGVETAMAIDSIESDSESPWNPILNDIAEKLDTTRAEHHRQSLNAHFFVMFWQLTLYDIWNPEKTYLGIITKVRTDWIQADSERDSSSGGRERKEKKKKDLDQLSAALKIEQKDQKANYEKYCSQIAREKSHWFTQSGSPSSELIRSLLEECFLPRLTMSPIDAVFCFKFIKFLHLKNTPNFRTIGLLDQFFSQSRLANFIFTCTSREAENLGIFLRDVLEDLGRLHAKKETYQNEALGPKNDLTGFSKNASMSVLFEFDEFRTLLFKWHNALLKSLEACLLGEEYMHRRNALFIMKAIHKSFPVIDFMGQKLLNCVEDIFEKDDRGDLKLAARSLYGVLKPRSSKWILHHEFRTPAYGNSKRSSSRQGQRSSNGTPDAFTQMETPKALNAKAEEFKPSRPNVTPNPAVTEAEESHEVNEIVPKDLEKVDSKPAPPGHNTEADAARSTQKQGDGLTAKAATGEIVNASTSGDDSQQVSKAKTRANDTSAQKPLNIAQSAKAISGPILSSTRPPVLRENSNQPNTNRPPPQSQRPSDYRSSDRTGPKTAPRELHRPETGRLDRPPDLVRDPHRDRKGQTPSHRAPEGPGDRSLRQWDRDDLQWNGSRGAAPRTPYDRLPPRMAAGDDRPGPRQLPDWNERMPRDPFPDRDGPSSIRPPSHSTRQPRDPPAPPIRPTPQMGQVHPDRLAATFGATRNDPPRPERDLRDRNGRLPSPPRTENYRQPSSHGPSRATHSNDSRNPPASDRSWQGRARSDVAPPPTEPRGDRLPRGPEGGAVGSDRGRDLFAAPPPPQRPTDPDGGRLNRESRQGNRYPDPNPGRISNTSEPESRRGPPQGPLVRSYDNPPTRSLRSSQIPDGPVSNPSSVPTTPINEMSPNEVPLGNRDHRDHSHRARNAHPTGRLPPLDTNGPSRGVPPPSQPMRVAPVGPRSASGNWSLPPSPQHRGPLPPGPVPSERGRGNTRQLQGIQNVLQQSVEPERQERVSNTRSRGGRSNGYNPPTPTEPLQGNPIPNGDSTQGSHDVQGPRGGGGRHPPRDDGGREGERRSNRRRASKSASPSRNSSRRDDTRGRKDSSANNNSPAVEERALRRGGGREDRRDRRDLRDRIEPRDDSKTSDVKQRRPSDDVTNLSRDDGSSRNAGYRKDERDGAGRKRGRQMEEMNGERGTGDAKRSRR